MGSDPESEIVPDKKSEPQLNDKQVDIFSCRHGLVYPQKSRTQVPLDRLNLHRHPSHGPLLRSLTAECRQP